MSASSEPAGPRLDGATHVNLTVRDLDRSTRWYCATLGFTVVRDAAPQGSGFRFCTLVHSRALASVVLGQPTDAGADPGRFDERRAGLHHLAFHVPERAELDTWAEHLDRLGVAHSGVKELYLEAGYGIWLRDPDHIWLELYWLNKAYFMARMRQQWRSARAASVAGAAASVDSAAASVDGAR